ncbi:Extracellular metalloproteinase mep [Hypsizygus marmoreus]|uniref:Extracellular metalloproteinase n=1 Tax=Hypsizygus marmoreus TaxID=39966 RepID=A0A369JBF7_HYPMA|nr:Extracellular metalloproteinase mep [Hypsizygus marmoreus]
MAVPYPAHSKFSTHRSRIVGRDVEIETYHPATTYETFGEGIDHPLSKRADSTIKDSAIAFAESHLKVDAKGISFKSAFSGEVTKHAFLRQSHDGIPFANAVANVAFNHDDKVVAFGSSFVTPKSITASTPSITVGAAITAAEQSLSGKFNSHPATLEYFAKQDGSVVLTHVVQIQNEEHGTFFEAFIDAHSGELVSITDFVAKASYRVLPLQKEILTQGFETLTDPQDLSASPNGWHNTGTTSTTTTAGNNVISFAGSSQGAVSSQSSTGLNFVFTQNAAVAPNSGANIDAARVNAFYVVNSVHDLTYKYGFTESAFNFQTNNFGLGGAQNDRVTVSVQSTAGIDNADFTTPPDGQSGSMRMYLWDLTSPRRDGALENDIIVHENTHGVTNRMTGGGTGRCLQTTEAGGMGEGWSDALAEWTEHTSSATPDFVLGQYVINDPTGIRTHPYSTSTSVNPLRYSSIKALNEVHNIGEVWANMLHNVYAALVTARGWSATARTDPTGTAGNVVFLHLFIDALPLQPCNPTFVAARDAWIQADINRYAGANKCTIWKAFASRGLGVGAAGFSDSSTVPAGC